MSYDNDIPVAPLEDEDDEPEGDYCPLCQRQPCDCDGAYEEYVDKQLRRDDVKHNPVR